MHVTLGDCARTEADAKRHEDQPVRLVELRGAPPSRAANQARGAPEVLQVPAPAAAPRFVIPLAHPATVAGTVRGASA